MNSFSPYAYSFVLVNLFFMNASHHIKIRHLRNPLSSGIQAIFTEFGRDTIKAPICLSILAANIKSCLCFYYQMAAFYCDHMWCPDRFKCVYIYCLPIAFWTFFAFCGVLGLSVWSDISEVMRMYVKFSHLNKHSKLPLVRERG